MKILKKSFLLLFLLVAIMPMLAGCLNKEPKLELNVEFKNEYVIGETLDVTGGILLYTDKTGHKTYVEMQENMITGFSTETAGERSMIISYENETILFTYSVNPVSFKLNVPYYTQTSTGENPRYAVVIFNSDNTISMWTTTVLPTLSNASSLFNGSSEDATLVATSTYTKEVVENQYYLISFNAGVQGMQVEIPTTVKVIDANNLVLSQELEAGQPPYTITLTAAN